MEDVADWRIRSKQARSFYSRWIPGAERQVLPALLKAGLRIPLTLSWWYFRTVLRAGNQGFRAAIVRGLADFNSQA